MRSKDDVGTVLSRSARSDRHHRRELHHSRGRHPRRGEHDKPRGQTRRGCSERYRPYANARPRDTIPPSFFPTCSHFAPARPKSAESCGSRVGRERKSLRLLSPKDHVGSEECGANQGEQRSNPPRKAMKGQMAETEGFEPTPRDLSPLCGAIFACDLADVHLSSVCTAGLDRTRFFSRVSHRAGFLKQTRGTCREPLFVPGGMVDLCYSRPTFSMSSQNSAATSAETVARVAEIAAT